MRRDVSSVASRYREVFPSHGSDTQLSHADIWTLHCLFCNTFPSPLYRQLWFHRSEPRPPSQCTSVKLGELTKWDCLCPDFFLSHNKIRYYYIQFKYCCL